MTQLAQIQLHEDQFQTDRRYRMELAAVGHLVGDPYGPAKDPDAAEEIALELLDALWLNETAAHPTARKVWGIAKHFDRSRGHGELATHIVRECPGSMAQVLDFLEQCSELAILCDVSAVVGFFDGDRAKRKILSLVESATKKNMTPTEAQNLLERTMDSLDARPEVARVPRSARTLLDILGETHIKKDSAINGLLKVGKKSLLTGWTGIGKTFVVFQLAIAVASGTEFLGFKCRKMSVGLLTLEMSDDEVHDRFQDIQATSETLRNIHVITSDDIPTERMDITKKHVLSAVVRLIEKHGIEFLILDPLFNFASGKDLLSSVEMDSIIEACDLLIAATGVTLFINHHEPKNAGEGSRAAFGSSRLVNAQALVMRLIFDKARHPARHRIEFAKVRSFQEPEPVNLTRTHGGIFQRAFTGRDQF